MDGRTPWTSDQLVARPLPKHRITQTQKNAHTHTHTPNIHALSVIRTNDPAFRASEDSACFRPLGYRDRRQVYYRNINKPISVFLELFKLLTLAKKKLDKHEQKLFSQ
jgi:hypothetical protein